VQSYEVIRLPLANKSPLEISTDICGHRVSLQLDASEVVVADVRAAGLKEAKKVASDCAESFLDSVRFYHGFSTRLMRGSVTATTRDAQTGKVTHHVAVTTRIACSISHRFVSSLSDSQRPGHRAFAHTMSMRYYRMASLAAGSYESFRNYYLAAESAASSLVGSAMRDKETFLRGMDSAFGSSDPDLARLAFDVDGADSRTTQQVGELLYKNYRCALSHAKKDSRRLIPMRAVDDAAVQRAVPLMERVAHGMIQAEVRQTAATQERPPVD